MIQASGLNGPIPPGVALLEKLSDLWVSTFYVTTINHFQMELHLNYYSLRWIWYAGELVTWMDLKNLFHHLIIWHIWRHCKSNVSMTWFSEAILMATRLYIDIFLFCYRILRSCNITGRLPEFLGDMTTLKTLLV